MSDTATAQRSRPRLATMRAIGVWIALVAAVFGMGALASTATANSAAHARRTAPAAPAARAHDRTLAGTWNLTVTIVAPDGSTVSTTPVFTFHANHRLDAVGPPDSAGAPAYHATGFWNTKDDGSIAFYINHNGRSDAVYVGAVQALHIGTFSRDGKSFATHAYAFVTQQDGSLLGPVTVSSKGTWVSATD